MDIATILVDNCLPGVWQCGNISSNACSWDGIEVVKQLGLALLNSGVNTRLLLPEADQPLLHFLIQLAMDVLDGLIAVRAVGWVGQQLPALPQNLGCLVVDCSMVKAENELLVAPQPCFQPP